MCVRDVKFENCSWYFVLKFKCVVIPLKRRLINIIILSSYNVAVPIYHGIHG